MKDITVRLQERIKLDKDPTVVMDLLKDSLKEIQWLESQRANDYFDGPMIKSY